VFKQPQTGVDAPELGIAVVCGERSPTGGVVQPQAVHRVIEKEGGVGIEIQQVHHHHAALSIHCLKARAQSPPQSKKNGLHSPALGHQQLLMDDQGKVELAFMDVPGGSQVVGATTEMVERHGSCSGGGA